MQFARMSWGSALTLAGLQVLLAGPLQAADQSGIRTVAEELGSRTKPQSAPEGAPKGMSDSRVRVMSTYALSILPDQVTDKSGTKIKLDKSNPNIYLIPIDDARRVIRVATRSAYAEACQLPELEKANFQAMYLTEQARNVWSREQMMFIQALHTFATSYFAGNVKITEEADTPAAAKSEAAKPDAAATTITPKKLECPPGQKEKVTQAIDNYVKSTGASLPAAEAPQLALPQALMPQTPATPAGPEKVAPIPPMAPIPMGPAPVAGSAN
jgi:hypothetical protein